MPEVGVAGAASDAEVVTRRPGAAGAPWRLTLVVAAAGLALHAVVLVVLDLLGAAQAHAAPVPWVAAAVVALVVARSSPIAVGAWVVVLLVWALASLVHHLAGGFVAAWGEQPVSGWAHVAWDVAYHLPLVVVLAFVLARRLRSARPRSRPESRRSG